MFLREVYLLAMRFEKLASTASGEERGVAEDVFVGGEETLLWTNA